MIYVDANRCAGCGACVDVCPTGALSLQHDQAVIDQGLCTACLVCREACAYGAIVLAEAMPPAVSQPAEPVGQVVTSQRREMGPVIGAALLWAGRELVPRLASLALAWWDRRARSPLQFSTGATMKGQGRRYRQRQRRGR